MANIKDHPGVFVHLSLINNYLMSDRSDPFKKKKCAIKVERKKHQMFSHFHSLCEPLPPSHSAIYLTPTGLGVTTIQHFLSDNLGEILNISLFGKIYEATVPSPGLSNINQSIIEFFNADNSFQGRCWSPWILAVILLLGALDINAQDDDPADPLTLAGGEGGDGGGDDQDEAWEYVTYLKERRCEDSYICIYL